jgi:hypothetical protein
MRAICALAVAAVLLATVGCGGNAEVNLPAQAATTTSATITATPCVSEEVRSLVVGFLEAFNRGEAARLDRLFAASDFEWYSTDTPGARLNSAAYDRKTLVNYFGERRARGERLELRTFKFNGYSDGYGHFEYGLVRSADDLAPTNYYGKGAAICTDGADVIAAWSMGRE